MNLIKFRGNAVFAALGAAVALAGAGCQSGDDATAPAPTPPPAPVMIAEPAFSPGTANTVAWAAAPGDGDAGGQWQAQRARDDAFTLDVVSGDWTDQPAWTVEGLADGETWHFRARRRDAAGAVSAWSPPVASTQDASPPAAAVRPLAEDQTSYRFDLEIDLADAGSGVASFELWSAWDGGAPALVGTCTGSPVTVVVDSLGRHGFMAVATDAVGNRQAMPSAPQAATTVPPRIVIVDRQGEHFDITHAVLRYFVRVDGWDHGLGRHAIQPINFPAYWNPGEFGYPDDDNFSDVLAVNYGGVQKAWRLGDIADREVVNDRAPGVEFAATY